MFIFFFFLNAGFLFVELWDLWSFFFIFYHFCFNFEFWLVSHLLWIHLLCWIDKPQITWSFNITSIGKLQFDLIKVNLTSVVALWIRKITLNWRRSVHYHRYFFRHLYWLWILITAIKILWLLTFYMEVVQIITFTILLFLLFRNHFWIDVDNFVLFWWKLDTFLLFLLWYHFALDHALNFYWSINFWLNDVYI